MTEERAEYHPQPQAAHSASERGIRPIHGRILAARWRCHDGQCRARMTCELWLTRDDDDQSALHCPTLRERWLMPTEPCGAYTGPELSEDDE